MGKADDLAALVPTAEARAEPSNALKLEIDRFFGDLLGLDATAVYTTTVSKPGNLTVRFGQSNRARSAAVPVAMIEKPEDLEGVLRAAETHVGPGRRRAVLVVGETPGNGWGVQAIVEPRHGPFTSMLQRHWPALIRHEPVTPPDQAAATTALTVPLAMDPKTGRMARLAIASSPAVMFVGPPGTGKNRLLREILKEIELDPTSYGFKKAREVVIEPAEEGWTTRDLVGGETIDESADNKLRFRPGRVLDAVANDRWLVIDEANRADLDRIFGGLLTWLSGEQVVVGRASTKVGAPLVRLGWTDRPDSYAQGFERLSEDEVGEDPIDYFAGTEFRLIGTYNALDAQRVFRFGLALGRRFAQVPIPPASPSDFELILQARTIAIADASIREIVFGTVSGLYLAHHLTAGAQLGPAMLLGIPEYVAKGIELAGMSGIDPGSEEDIEQLIVEAYLLAAGSWLARLDDHELQSLGSKLTSAGPPWESPVLNLARWDWLASQLPNIGG